jgi:acyl-CoA reductase-like NAD-dependent aldehyde dehydrogenase
MTIPHYPLLINGEQVSTPKDFEVENPSISEAMATVSEATPELVNQALSCSQKTQSTWADMAPVKRKEIILKYAELLEQNRDRIIDLLRLETGKPLDNAEYDFGMLTTCLKFFVEEVERLDQPVLHDPEGRFLHYLQRQPLGVVVGLLAWNFPLLNLGYKLGPVLASGCGAVIKPSPYTPVATLEACYLLKEAGVPDGLINVITSCDNNNVESLLTSSIPSMVTMIGSTRGGKEVMKNSCTSIKRFSVELGGNAPVLVYPDADIEAAAEKIVNLKFANSGQVCVSPNRCYVHESVKEAFLKAVHSVCDQVSMGPLIHDGERERVLGLVKESVAHGAKLERGGSAVDGPGFFMEPTILTDLSHDNPLRTKEIFGPILPIYTFNDDDDEVSLANDVDDGLAAYVFTTDLQKGLAAARDIQAGSVCINEPHYSIQLPHGGVKQSGVGKDCSSYSLEEYLTLKRVSVLVEK